jgi:hypothetical protein
MNAVTNLCSVIAKYIEMESVLECTKECKCSDPRDRIFALLSLGGMESGYQIKPDYTKSTHEVYDDAFKRITAVRKKYTAAHYC